MLKTSRFGRVAAAVAVRSAVVNGAGPRRRVRRRRRLQPEVVGVTVERREARRRRREQRVEQVLARPGVADQRRLRRRVDAPACVELLAHLLRSVPQEVVARHAARRRVEPAVEVPVARKCVDDLRRCLDEASRPRGSGTKSWRLRYCTGLVSAYASSLSIVPAPSDAVSSFPLPTDCA